MGNEVDNNKFTWIIKNFTSVESKFIFSDHFVIDGCKWQLVACPKGYNGIQCLSVYLMTSGFKALPCGWRRHVKYRLTVVNRLSDKLSKRQAETQHWFDKKIPLMGYPEMLSLSKLHAKDGGFIVNNEVKIVAEVEVLQVIDKLNVRGESQEVNQPLKRTRLNDDGDVPSHLHTVTSSVKETIDVNGFQVLPSQAESVKHIFEKHPEIALECRAKNQDMRTSYINVLLSLIKMLFKSPMDASTDDLYDAAAALTCLKNVGFKLDWLENRLDEVKDNTKKCARVCEMEQQLLDLEQQMHDLKQKTENLETQLNKEKAEILLATTPDLYFNDVV